jgi:ribonucleoside-diphosphate reductase alpha chain/ribonucleoside-triphosphate reductase
MATDEQRSWLKDTYVALREYDKQYSIAHNFPPSIKITTVKPSGTLSLLSGASSGAHPAYSHYLIRRVRMASNIPLIDVCRKNGYPIEYEKNFDGTENRNTVIVSFPCAFPLHTKVAKDMTAIDQLEVVKRLQSEWSDNAVSVTVYYRKEELDSIKAWLNVNYNDNLKTVSFLLHSDHGFAQAPLEEITKEQYDELTKNILPITGLDSIVEESVSSDTLGCETGVCPIK